MKNQYPDMQRETDFFKESHISVYFRHFTNPAYSVSLLFCLSFVRISQAGLLRSNWLMHLKLMVCWIMMDIARLWTTRDTCSVQSSCCIYGSSWPEMGLLLGGLDNSTHNFWWVIFHDISQAVSFHTSHLFLL